MKELDRHNQDISKHQVEIEAQKQEQQEFKFESSFKPRKGHKVWEINLETEEVREAAYHSEDVLEWSNRNILKTKDIIRRAGHIYIGALNPKSALKRYRNGKGHSCVPVSTFNLNPFK